MYETNKKYHKAEELYLTALTYNPQNIRILYLIGHLYLTQKRHEESEHYLQLCIRSTTTPFFPCYGLLASNYAASGNFDKALQTYKTQLSLYKRNSTSLSNNPSLGTIHLKMAEIYHEKKLYNLGLKNTKQARKLVPKSWVTYKKASSLLVKLEKEIEKIDKARRQKLLAAKKAKAARLKLLKRKKRHRRRYKQRQKRTLSNTRTKYLKKSKGAFKPKYRRTKKSYRNRQALKKSKFLRKIKKRRKRGKKNR